MTNVTLPTHARFRNLTGMKFSRLTAIAFAGMRRNCRHSLSHWKCECECGKVIIVSANALLKSNTKSCGCLATHTRRESNVTHGRSRKPIYITWSSMHDRCRNPCNKAFQYYGGRGIHVCNRWSDFANFLSDMGDKPSHSHSLDRIDVNRNYEPSNCRWVTHKEQMRNTRKTLKVTFCGETKLLVEWAEQIGVTYRSLHKRLFQYHWSIDKAISTPSLTPLIKRTR